MFNLLVSALITVACFYYGILYENAPIITVGYTLLVLIVLSWIEVVYRMFTVKCHLDIPITMVDQNMPVSVIVKMNNKSFLPCGRADVRMRIRNSLAQKGKIRWFSIPSVSKKKSQYKFKVVLHGAGSHEVELIKLRIHSTLGLVTMTKRCKDFGSILVLPEIHSVPLQISDGTKNFLGDADVFDEFRPGHDPGETFEIREYREKDKLQSIHWKLSAKTEDLMVKEHSLPRACAIVLLLELKEIPKKQIEVLIPSFLELISSISFCLMDNKTPHFIAWFSKETGDVRRIRVDDEESFYIFLAHYLQEGVTQKGKDLREEYREKYRSEWYLHDVCINNQLEVFKNGELVYKLNAKSLKDECEKMELLL